MCKLEALHRIHCEDSGCVNGAGNFPKGHITLVSPGEDTLLRNLSVRYFQ